MYLFIMKPIVFFCAFFLLLNWSCSKDPDLVPKIDYRDAFVGTYEVNFTMYSSSSYMLQTPLRHTGVSVERCVVRKAVESDASAYGRRSSSWRTGGIVISNVPFLQPGDGRKYNTTWYELVDNAGDASRPGYSWVIFRNDSLDIGQDYGNCYAKYYTCRTSGKGRKVQ